ncbi:MAG: hypothetical protein KAY24_07000, partial [Candidatus Eisenbacteria sp.]|nr:hypothetical protein [Candidatus Eisenbacteria bacterium]
MDVETTSKSNLYDRGFLDLMHGFETILGRGVDSVQFEGVGAPGRPAPVRVTREALPGFRELVSRIPDPQQVRVAGKLDQIRDSDCSLILRLPGGEEAVRGIASPSHLSLLRELWGRPVLVTGRAHFNVAGGVQ